MSDHCVELLQHYFFSRTDKVAFRTSYGKPNPANAGESLVDLLTAHVRGKDVPPVTITYRNGNGDANKTGHFRIGSYTPNSDGLTKWLCIDFDGGPDHPNGLIDPKQAVLLSQQRANDFGIPAYIECSGGGSGWHLWIFFDPMVPAFFARQLGLLLCPTNLPLANGEIADARVNRGIEVFPKQAKIKPDGFGNLLWLPWWHHAKSGGNEFYVQSMLGRFDPLLPEQFETVTLKEIEQTLSAHPPSAPESVPTRRNTLPSPRANHLLRIKVSSSEDKAYPYNNNTKFLPIALSLNGSFALSPEIWKNPKVDKLEVVTIYSKSEKSSVASLIDTILANKSSYLAEDVVRIYGDAAVRVLVERFSEDKDLFDYRWKHPLVNHQAVILEVIESHDITASSMLLLTRLYDPLNCKERERLIKLIENYLTKVIDIDHLDTAIVAFGLTLSIQDKLNIHLLKVLFQQAFDALYFSHMDYSYWIWLEKYAPITSKSKEWDKCERLASSVSLAFARERVLPSDF